MAYCQCHGYIKEFQNGNFNFPVNTSVFACYSFCCLHRHDHDCLCFQIIIIIIIPGNLYFWRLKVFYNLEKNVQCANTHIYIHKSVVYKQTKHTKLIDIFIQSIILSICLGITKTWCFVRWCLNKS